VPHVEEGDAQPVPVLQPEVNPEGIACQEEDGQPEGAGRPAACPKSGTARNGPAGKAQDQGRSDQDGEVGPDLGKCRSRQDRGGTRQGGKPVVEVEAQARQPCGDVDESGRQGGGHRRQQDEQHGEGQHDEAEDRNEEEVGHEGDVGDPVEVVHDEGQGAQRRGGRNGKEKGEVRGEFPQQPFSPPTRPVFPRGQALRNPRHQKQDGRHGRKGQLERDVEQGGRGEREDNEGGKGQGVGQIPCAAHQDGHKQGERHEQGPHRRHAETGDEGVEDDRTECGKGGELLKVEPQQEVLRRLQQGPDDKEGDEGDDPDVEARYGDDVGCPRPVEPVLDLPRDFALLPEGHGLDERPFGERGPGADPLADDRPEPFQGLPPGRALPLADQNDFPGVVHEAPHPDSLEAKMALVVEAAGVCKAARDFQSDRRADVIPVFEIPRVLPDGQQEPAADVFRCPLTVDPHGLQDERRAVLGDPRVFRDHAVQDDGAFSRPVHDVVRPRVAVEDRAQPADSKGEEADCRRTKRSAVAARHVETQRKDEPRGEERQGPPTGDLRGVTGDDSAEEKSEQQGEGALDHVPYPGRNGVCP